MLPSFYIQIFNTAFNVIEAILLCYIALQSWSNNQAIKEKQFHTLTRLDHLTDLTKDYIVSAAHKNKNVSRTPSPTGTGGS
jgi:hypothetical protein